MAGPGAQGPVATDFETTVTRITLGAIAAFDDDKTVAIHRHIQVAPGRLHRTLRKIGTGCGRRNKHPCTQTGAGTLQWHGAQRIQIGPKAGRVFADDDPRQQIAHDRRKANPLRDITQRERSTEVGPVDLWCRDAEGRVTLVEVKRVRAVAAVSLRR